MAHRGHSFSVETHSFSVETRCYFMEISLLRAILPLFCHEKPFLHTNTQFLRGRDAASPVEKRTVARTGHLFSIEKRAFSAQMHASSAQTRPFSAQMHAFFTQKHAFSADKSFPSKHTTFYQIKYSVALTGYLFCLETRAFSAAKSLFCVKTTAFCASTSTLQSSFSFDNCLHRSKISGNNTSGGGGVAVD